MAFSQFIGNSATSTVLSVSEGELSWLWNHCTYPDTDKIHSYRTEFV